MRYENPESLQRSVATISNSTSGKRGSIRGSGCCVGACSLHEAPPSDFRDDVLGGIFSCVIRDLKIFLRDFVIQSLKKIFVIVIA